MSRPRFRPVVYDLEKDNSFVTRVSTNTTDEYPDVVFLRAKVRLTPIESKKSYEKEIASITSEFKDFSKNVLDSDKSYDRNYIFSVDVAEKSVKYKKMSHFRYDIFLKPKIKAKMEQHVCHLKTISDELDKKLVDLFVKYNLKWE